MNEILDEIQAPPNGSRFYRSAFQVNTYEYVKRHRHETPFVDEDSYNEALIEACLEQGLEVIGRAGPLSSQLFGGAEMATKRLLMRKIKRCATAGGERTLPSDDAVSAPE